MLRRKSIYSEDCLKGEFIGVDYGITGDLTGNPQRISGTP